MKLSAKDYEDIQFTILHRLYKKKAWGKGHILYARLQRGIEPHLRGFVKCILQDLLHQGLVCHYGKTLHGDAYYLNISKKVEIEKIIFQTSR